MLAKLFRSITGKSEPADWESMLTHFSADSLGGLGGSSGAEAGLGQRLSDGHASSNELNLALLGLSGQEVFQRACEIAQELRDLAEHGANMQQWNLLLRDITALADLGTSINTLAPVKLRSVTPKIQSIQMLPMMGSILAKRTNDLRRSGVLLVPKLQACSLDGDPDVVKAVIETALEWIIPFGNRLTVITQLSSWGSAANVLICADQVVRTQEASSNTPMERTRLFLWELLNELAQQSSVTVSRSQVEDKTTVSLEFPAHVAEDGIASPELHMHTAPSRSLVRMDVLVYVADGAARLAVERALIRTESKPRFVKNLRTLVRECELSVPAALLVQSDLLDEGARSLVADLRRHVGHIAIIELTLEPNIYDVAAPGNNNCRLSVASVEQYLHEALMFELAR